MLEKFNNLEINQYMILIGSCAEFFYQDILPNYISSFSTMDLDFYLPNIKFSTEIDFIKEMENIGYIYQEDILSGKSKFYNDEGIEIEFLTNLNRNYNSVDKVRGLNINAECLKYLDIFENNNIAFHANEKITIHIPTPEAYVIHKLIINNQRKPEKQKKDIYAVGILIDSIQNSPHHASILMRLYESLNKKRKKFVNDSCTRNNITFFQNYDQIIKHTIDENINTMLKKYAEILDINDDIVDQILSEYKDELSENIFEYGKNRIIDESVWKNTINDFVTHHLSLNKTR